VCLVPGTEYLLQTPYFTGLVFHFFWVIFGILVNFEDFWASFFIFLSFFRFPNTVYSHGGRHADVLLIRKHF
jgi:hypothetical protein